MWILVTMINAPRQEGRRVAINLAMTTPWRALIITTILLPRQEGRRMAINLAMTTPWRALISTTILLPSQGGRRVAINLAMTTPWRAPIITTILFPTSRLMEVDALGSRRRKKCKCLLYIPIHLHCFQYNQIECIRFSPHINLTIYAFNMFNIFKLNVFDVIQPGYIQIECFSFQHLFNLN